MVGEKDMTGGDPYFASGVILCICNTRDWSQLKYRFKDSKEKEI
jgi:hypothetical protein